MKKFLCALLLAALLCGLFAQAAGAEDYNEGDSLPSFLAGSQAEIHTVITVTRSVSAKTRGWYPKDAGCLPSTFRANKLDSSRIPALAAIPTRSPARTGAAQRAAASCKRQERICLGVAPTLEKMPN